MEHQFVYEQDRELFEALKTQRNGTADPAADHGKVNADVQTKWAGFVSTIVSNTANAASEKEDVAMMSELGPARVDKVVQRYKDPNDPKQLELEARLQAEEYLLLAVRSRPDNSVEALFKIDQARARVAEQLNLRNERLRKFS